MKKKESHAERRSAEKKEFSLRSLPLCVRLFVFLVVGGGIAFAHALSQNSSPD